MKIFWQLRLRKKPPQEIKDRLRTALAKNNLPGDLDTAWISTIHGFCARVLREQWYVLGLSPQFTILSEAPATVLLEQAIHETIAEYLQQDNTEILQLLSVYKEKQLVAHCADMISQLMAGGLTSTDCHNIADQTPETTWQNFCQAREAYLEKIAQELQQLLQVLATVSTAKRSEEIRQQLLQTQKKTATEYLTTISAILDGFRAAKAPTRVDEQEHAQVIGLIKKIKEHCKSTQPLLGPKNTQDDLDMQLTKYTMTLIAAAYARYQKLKHAANLLDYEDLQLKTLELFQNPEISRNYRQKFATIMLDEFQDTNPLQDKIFKCIVRENNLCLVGDWKQSIYLFRNADVSIFRNYIEQFQTRHTGTVIPLQENFRSTPAILSFVNEVCTPLFCATALRTAHGRPERNKCRGPAAVHTITFYRGRTRLRTSANVKHRHWQLPYSKPTLKESGTKVWPYYSVRFSNLGIYEQALKTAGIPYMIVGGRGYYQTPEIQDIVQYLTILDNPENDLALAAVLRSDIVGLADPTLVLLRAAAPKQLMTALSPEYWQQLPLDEQSRLTRFKRTFDDLRHCVDTVSLPNLISLIYEKTQYPTLVLSYPVDGPRMLANLNKLQEIALQSRTASLESFIRLIEQLVLKESREEEAPLLATEDAVKIMTIHKSKGMQFTAVFLPALHQFAAMATRDSFLYDHKLTEKYALTLGIQYARIPGDRDTAVKTKIYTLLKLLRDTAEQEETKRLFYVAATRAEEKLWLIHSYPENKEYTAEALATENWGAWLRYLFQTKQLKNHYLY